jgi:hypothetical protein
MGVFDQDYSALRASPFALLWAALRICPSGVPQRFALQSEGGLGESNLLERPHKGEQHCGERRHRKWWLVRERSRMHSETVRAGPQAKQDAKPCGAPLLHASGPPVSGEGEGGCLFDEISNLGEPAERLHMDVQTGMNSHGRRGVARTARPTKISATVHATTGVYGRIPEFAH